MTLCGDLLAECWDKLVDLCAEYGIDMTAVSYTHLIINAIYQACGARVRHLPARPEKVLAALKK